MIEFNSILDWSVFTLVPAFELNRYQVYGSRFASTIENGENLQHLEILEWSFKPTMILIMVYSRMHLQFKEYLRDFY